MARRSGLGKGLGALIPTTERLQESDSQLRELPISEISPNTYQPRSRFDEEAIVSLSESIRQVGVLQPIIVRPTGEDSYELIAGERRWRASKRAGLATIPAIIRETEDVAALENALVENLHREDLGPLEEASAYLRLIEEFDYSQDAVAKKVGKSRSAVANSVRLLQLPAGIQKYLADGQLTAGHGKALLGTPDRAFQERLAKAAVAEHLTVREVEDRVREHEGTAIVPPTTEPEVKGEKVGVTRPAAMLQLEEILSAHLDTRVSVASSARKGRITIEFSTLDDLERIYRVIIDGREAEV